jgi:type IV pilus assembly protein PilY1
VGNGIDRWVFVGTGKLYDDSDLLSNQTQTMYALRDGTQTAPLAFPGPFPLTRASLTPLPNVVGLNNFGLATKPANGWLDDMPADVNGNRPRIVVPPQAALFVVAWVGTSAQNDPCLTGQMSTAYARLFSTGQTVLFDGGGAALDGVPVAEGAVGLEIVSFATPPGTTQMDMRLAITLGTTGEVRFINLTLPSPPPGHRMSWRLLGQ